ncbi:MAG: ATP-binding cassette domain-containing protein, partial [Ignavibacteriales bacterium]|nr:ATP-binding cassette domain-containing protein [Ignavibacteriales bacterium]
MGLKKVLDVEMIRKQFSLVTAVADLSFSMYEGEIFALLGPNGAGKTTTVRMLNGIIQPDSGRITFHLQDGSDHSPLSSVLGYLPEERGLYQEVSILKTLTFMGIIRGLGRKNAAFAAEKWLEQLELLDRKNEKLNTLSKGNQQKVQFIVSPTFSHGYYPWTW